jgi:hypothetical protein
MSREEPHYQIAQICTNGHVVRSTLESAEEAEGRYCERCGMQTITRCLNCREPIQGEIYNPHVAVIGVHFPAPPFCIYCGNPFPWTESGLKAAKEYAEELTNLSPEEKETLKKSIDDIVKDSAQTNVAVVRFKRLVPKGGKEASEVLKSILINLATQAAKDAIWGGHAPQPPT